MIPFVDVNYKSLPFQFFNNRYLPTAENKDEKDETAINAESIYSEDVDPEGFQDEDRKEYSTEGARSCETAYKEG